MDVFTFVCMKTFGVMELWIIGLLGLAFLIEQAALEMSFWKNLPSHSAQISKRLILPELEKILAE